MFSNKPAPSARYKQSWMSGTKIFSYPIANAMRRWRTTAESGKSLPLDQCGTGTAGELDSAKWPEDANARFNFPQIEMFRSGLTISNNSELTDHSDFFMKSRSRSFNQVTVSASVSQSTTSYVLLCMINAGHFLPVQFLSSQMTKSW